MTELLNWLMQRDMWATLGGAALAFVFAWWVLSVVLSLAGAVLGWLYLTLTALWVRAGHANSPEQTAMPVDVQADPPQRTEATRVERDMTDLQAWARQHGVHWLNKPTLDLTTLTWANLYRANVHQLPEALCSLPALQRLDLRFNPLTHLPERMGDLHNLQSLDVYEARLIGLPPSFTQLHRLSYCQLVAQLTALPADFGNLKALTFLDLSGNQLATLPDSMRYLTGLQTLKLNGNRLTDLPEWIGQLPALASLDVRGNPLTQLPASLSECPTLRHLAHDPALPAPDLARWRAMRAGPLGHMQVAFAKTFSYFGHELPSDDVLHRRRGMLSTAAEDDDACDYGYGNAVRYLFDRDEQGEYLDCYMHHRLAGDLHLRIREDSSTETLETVPVWRQCADDPAEDAKLEAAYRATVQRISTMLHDKGFD